MLLFRGSASPVSAIWNSLIPPAHKKRLLSYKKQSAETEKSNEALN